MVHACCEVRGDAVMDVERLGREARIATGTRGASLDVRRMEFCPPPRGYPWRTSLHETKFSEARIWDCTVGRDDAVVFRRAILSDRRGKQLAMGCDVVYDVDFTGSLTREDRKSVV